MKISIYGNNMQAALHIYGQVGPRRFRCSDCDKEMPMLKTRLRSMVDSGILKRYRGVHAGRAVNEYTLTTEAIVKIKQEAG